MDAIKAACAQVGESNKVIAYVIFPAGVKINTKSKFLGIPLNFLWSHQNIYGYRQEVKNKLTLKRMKNGKQ